MWLRQLVDNVGAEMLRQQKKSEQRFNNKTHISTDKSQFEIFVSTPYKHTQFDEAMHKLANKEQGPNEVISIDDKTAANKIESAIERKSRDRAATLIVSSANTTYFVNNASNNTAAPVLVFLLRVSN